jgi:Domain of unknown function (DUF4112)
MANPTESTHIQDPDLKQLDVMAKLLDNQFGIPGTNYRFGLDGIIGLIPFVGDMIGLLVSGALFRIMLKKGAGPIIMLRMAGNVALDTIIGVVPLIGDLFDFGFKANRRNVDLLQRYYATGKKRPSAKVSVSMLALLFFALMLALIYACWIAGRWLFTSAWGLI